MKKLLLCLLLLLVAAVPAQAGEAGVALAPVPYRFLVPAEIAARLSVSPLSGSWAAEVAAAGVEAAASVHYQPAAGEKVILFSAYYAPATAWDAAQKPDQPPPIGQELRRDNGHVLSIAGPLDVIFDPATADGKAVLLAVELLRQPERFEPER